MTDPTGDPDVLLERARALRPLIEAEADESERIGTTTKAVVDAVAEAGLFWLLVPRSLGGSETDIVTAIEVFEELAFADGSAGWSVMANATASCFAALYCADDGVAAMFPPGAPGIHGGMFGPVGVATRTDGGYRVSGSYRFGSGTGHATWIAAGVVEHAVEPGGAGDAVDGDRVGEALVTETGLPAMRICFFEPERVEMLGGWDVMGLVGTGSSDYRVDAQVVDAARTFPLLEAVQQRGGPHYGIGLFGLVASGHAGFALGVGRRALHEVIEIAASKQRMGSFETVAAQPRFQYELAMHDGAMRAARAYVLESFAEAEAVAARGEPLSMVQSQRLRQSTTYATKVAADVAQFAYAFAGTDALRPGVLQRAFRDIHAGTQHLYVDDSTLTAYGQALLATPADAR
jgi:alkylation response protein AidB-like acyl-CoA dehydrogenase